MNEGDEKLIERALMLRAKGYDAEEVTEEYVESEGEVKLVKRKITKKNVPPDITAIKMLIGNVEKSDLTEMTDEELIREKERLLGLLNTPSNNKDKKENNG